MTEIPDEVQRIFRAAPFIAELGMTLESLGKGECTTALVVRARHLQQDGFVHAGVQATMADHTAGAAVASLVAEGQYVLTVEFKINLLRAAKAERLWCSSKVLRPGRTFSVAESEVYALAAGDKRLVSKLTATIAVLDKKS